MLLVIYLLVALGVSFLCSMLEAVILSVPQGHVELLASQGTRSGKILQSLKREIDRPLAAILTLNTIAHTVGAAGVGAESIKLFGEQWVAATSAVLTLLVLVLSEIIPKTIGAVYAKALSPFVAYTIRALIVVCLPLVVALEWLSRLLKGSAKVMSLSREEFLSVAAIGQLHGALREEEVRIIQNLLGLRAVQVSDVMTPRPVIIAIPEEATIEEAVRDREALRFTRLPVYRGHVDQVIGIVHRTRLFEEARAGRGERPVSALVRPVHFVPESLSVGAALDRFIERREHIFVVLDEYGGTAGVVTLEDAMETLLGVEILDETDRVADLRQLARDLADRRREARGDAD